jgi:hypothetical protein
MAAVGAQNRIRLPQAGPRCQDRKDPALPVLAARMKRDQILRSRQGQDGGRVLVPPTSPARMAMDHAPANKNCGQDLDVGSPDINHMHFHDDISKTWNCHGGTSR